MQLTLNSTLIGLGTLGFISSAGASQSLINSTIQGLGTFGFLSSVQPTFNSTVAGIYTSIGNNVSTNNVSLSTLEFIDITTQSTGTLYQSNNLLYFNNTVGGLGSVNVIGGLFTLFSQVYS